MRINASGSRLWWVVLVFGLMCGEGAGLIIYRFGGESLPPPPEAGQEGVEFFQRRWTDLEATQRGEAILLDLDDRAIGALKRDPQVNIAPTATERGGLVFRKDVNGMVFDGDLNTVWPAERYLCAEYRYASWCFQGYAAPGTANLILGGQFLLDRVRVVSGLENPAGVARNIRIHLSSTIPWLAYHPPPFNPVIAEISDNREPILEISIPPHEPAAFFQIQLGEHDKAWEVAEVEVYARGYVDRSTYISNILDLGRPAAWGDLRWSGRRDSDAEVFIQTRSGADDESDLFWRFTGRGDEKAEVSRSEYQKLKLGEKAGITHDRENWTFWSAPYDFADSAGTAIVSLSPRRYLQVRVDFFPSGESGGEVEFLEVRASVPPAASELVAEISPNQVEVGKVSCFTYVLKPTIGADDTGFDRLEVSTSSVLVGVEGVRIDGAEVPFEVVAREEHRVEVGFPRVTQKESWALIEVEFNARVLRYGTTFDARVFDSSRLVEVAQRVNPGDATPRLEGNRVSVATSIGVGTLLAAEVLPGVFTPNGDGVNDVAGISYDLFEITGPVPVTIAIRDLAGRLVRTVYAGEDPLGHYRRAWDGRDQAGQMVPPGVYLYCVSVDADEEQADEIGAVHVVY